MKKIFVILMLVIISGCSSGEQKEEVISCSADKWGVTLIAQDVTPVGMKLLIKQEGGEPTGELQTGDFFVVEQKDGEEWQKYPTNPLIDYAWHQVAYMIKKNDTTEFEVEWKWLYDELPAGEYRLGKEIMDFRGPGDFDKEMYYAEFEVK